MDKRTRLPHEGAAQRDDGPDVSGNTEPTDTEGHSISHTGPGTGGDFSPRKPSSGGELIDDNDVEGHSISHTGPGTGGDFSPRRPSSGGESVGDSDNGGL